MKSGRTPRRSRMAPRLRAVAGVVPHTAASVADVGAGDGQLARHLRARGLHVIATERRPGPYARLRAALPELDCRQGEGLEVLRPGEVDGVVLAGFGGHTIARVLEASPRVVQALKWLVLQPQQHADHLLAWLGGAGYRVDLRATMAQGRHSYTVLLVRPYEHS
ncbi:MAG TPA: tRNA (adenine(22)-N(1))-methyltransferase TrmK [Candidatus Dormibacteraeota bacterium]|nr:tRNA (adenine(22)-N(1))-methyltransferase TrmK [Candidatus Dormibacteraeota bacterium]